MFARPPFSAVRIIVVLIAAGCSAGLFAAESAESAAPPARVQTPSWDFFEFVDLLPDNVSGLLPNIKPIGALRLYLRPRYGDLIRRDYLRVPFGGLLQVGENVELTGELQNYFTHGLRHSAGYGLSGLLLGVKFEHLLPDFYSGAISFGVNYSTPLSRPPADLSDGHRHLLPYVAATRPLMPRWQLLGYATLGADLLEHTAMPPHFGRNELHSNSLVLTAGAARQWKRFHTALSATLASTALLSDEGRQVFTLRPEIVVPLRPVTARTQILFTLGSHATWGPDGHDLGLSSSVRIESQVTGARH